jgi:putative aminopeptidase FrvX
MLDLNLFKALSNADAIAGQEGEVRAILINHLEGYADEVQFDGLGSTIFKRQGTTELKIAILAHLDEVGFMVRSISQEGLIELMVVGGVKPLAQHWQMVRITTHQNKKINGVLSGIYEDGKTTKLYADVGATTAEEVRAMGIETGDRVTYTTNFEEGKSAEQVVSGKAFDDRIGCFVMAEVLKGLKGQIVEPTLYFVATSSEEVGIRGAKTACHLINPDVVFVLDAACFSDEHSRNHTNQRQIGKGPILIHYDRTLAPNPKLLGYVKDQAKNLNIPLQNDMFNNGGTDGGEAHKINEGKPTVVTCLPLRYGHCALSLAHTRDIEQMITLYIAMLKSFTQETYNHLIDFRNN